MEHQWPNGIDAQIRAAEAGDDIEISLSWSSEERYWSVTAAGEQEATVTDASLADAMTFALERVGLTRGASS